MNPTQRTESSLQVSLVPVAPAESACLQAQPQLSQGKRTVLDCHLPGKPRPAQDPNDGDRMPHLLMCGQIGMLHLGAGASACPRAHILTGPDHVCRNQWLPPTRGNYLPPHRPGDCGSCELRPAGALHPIITNQLIPCPPSALSSALCPHRAAPCERHNKQLKNQPTGLPSHSLPLGTVAHHHG